MEINFWIQCNPKITVDHTAKKYFGKFLYKLVVYCPAGRIIDSKKNVADELEHRRMISKNINHGGWWGYRRNKDLDNADPEFISTIKEIRHDRSLGLKLRVEEPLIQIYSDSEQALQDVVKNHFTKSQFEYIVSIYGPKDSHAESILNSGAIIRKELNGYKYKVILKDGKYSVPIKESLLDFLDSQGSEQVSVPASTIRMLNKGTPFTWNMYLYTNDLGVVTFLNLISPGIVSNYHELVVLPNK